MKRSDPLRVLISAGGTGGHLFPALHVARALASSGRPIKIEFMGTGRPLEKQIIDSNGFKRHEIRIVGLKRRGVRGLLEFVSLLPAAVARVSSVLSTFKPDVIAGFGGYPTVLPVVLGRLRGIPAWIHESELRPGLANLALSPFVNRISVAFEKASVPFKRKHVLTGQPVREGLREAGQDNLPAGRPSRLLVLGGSQGATALDQAVLSLAPFLREKAIRVRHQSRPENVESLKRGLAEAGVEAEVVPFIDNPVEAFAWCHIIVSRSGASSVMEIEALNKPAILVPYPFAQGNHQAANARTLSERGKAIVVEEGEGFAARLRAALEHLLDRNGYEAMRSRPSAARSLGAAGMIAEGIAGLAQSKIR